MTREQFDMIASRSVVIWSEDDALPQESEGVEKALKRLFPQADSWSGRLVFYHDGGDMFVAAYAHGNIYVIKTGSYPGNSSIAVANLVPGPRPPLFNIEYRIAVRNGPGDYALREGPYRTLRTAMFLSGKPGEAIIRTVGAIAKPQVVAKWKKTGWVLKEAADK